MSRAKTLEFADGLELPPEAVTQTFAILGQRGSGKTYGATKLAEGMLEHGDQIVVLDPVGTWFGLRVGADVKGRGFDIPVLGGRHGDLELAPTAGAAVAALVVERRLSVVLDVSGFRKSAQKRFATEFAEELFHRKKAAPAPVHVFVDEAQIFVPQRLGAEDPRMLGAFEDIIRQGRNFGLGATLITQRPQSVNKEALSQTEVLVVLKLNEAPARRVLKEWIVDAGLDVGDLVETLPSLARGEAWVWSPSWLGVTKRVRIRRKRTLDTSATPELGAQAAVATRTLSSAELGLLREAMAEAAAPSVSAPAPRSGPRALSAPAVRVERVEVAVLGADVRRRLEALGTKLERLEALARGMSAEVRTVLEHPPREKIAGRQAQAETTVRPTADGADLKAGARRMLQALAHHASGLTRDQLGTWVGLPARGSTFLTYLSALKRAGLATEEGDLLTVTASGRRVAGSVPPPPSSTAALVELWGAKLKARARDMLRVLVDVHPRALTRGDLAASVDLPASGSTFATYLSTLRRLRLAEVRQEQVRASDSLFLRRAS